MTNEVSAVFHNGSNYYYHFIIKELENKFDRKFEYPCKITKKWKTFFFPIERKCHKIDKDENESVITLSHKIKFIDSVRFTTILL